MWNICLYVHIEIYVFGKHAFQINVSMSYILFRVSSLLKILTDLYSLLASWPYNLSKMFPPKKVNHTYSPLDFVEESFVFFSFIKDGINVMDVFLTQHINIILMTTN